MAASLSLQRQRPPSGESYKDCLGPKKRSSMNLSSKELSGQKSNTKCAESLRLWSSGLGSGQPQALRASRTGELWPLLPEPGPGQRHQGQGRALRSFGQPCSQLSKEEKITPITTQQILKMENHTLGKMCAATTIGKIELIILM